MRVRNIRVKEPVYRAIVEAAKSDGDRGIGNMAEILIKEALAARPKSANAVVPRKDGK